VSSAVTRKKNKPAQGQPPPSERSLLPLPQQVEEVFRQYFPGGLTIRDEANALVACAFRNGPLEDLHAGKHSELIADKSLSRITDEEMKALMINACQKMEELLRLKESNPGEYYTFIAQYAWRYCRRWER